ncbi:MAG: OmpH family outer membrane protein [Pseudomonadota bacterium]|nr:OmpH family outer membrane protein [Pseudomonadota bacterium]
MNIMQKLFLVCAFFSFAAMSHAELKVAVVDIEMAVRQSSSWQAAEARLANKFKSEEAKVKRLQNELKGLQQKFKSTGANMNNKEKLEFEHQYKTKELELQEIVYKQQVASQQETQKYMQTMMPKIEEIINTIVAQRKLDLIIARQAVQYVNPSLDITEEVTKRLK